jgi:serine/threonine protein kinase
MVYALLKCGLKPLVLYSLTNEAWKVTDFGFTMEGSSRKAHDTVYSRGTSSYRAPELILEAQAQYTNKVDMWGVGCILYELVFRRKAFGHDFEILQHAKSAKHYDFVIEHETVPDDRRRGFISTV